MQKVWLNEAYSVLRQYPVKVLGVKPRRQGFLIRTVDSWAWLQVWKNRSALKRHLQLQQGFIQNNQELAVSLCKTRKHEWIARSKDKGYTLSMWSSLPHLLEEPDELAQYETWGSLLGQVHQVVWGIYAKSFSVDEWIHSFQQGKRDFLELADHWNESETLAETERLFVTNIAPMVQRIELAVSILEDLASKPAFAAPGWFLGKGLTKAFVQLEDGKSRCSPWVTCYMGSGLADLGRLCLKAMEHPSSMEAVQSVVSGYEGQSALSSEAIQALLAYVVFPHSLWSMTQSVDFVEDVPLLKTDAEDLRRLLRFQSSHRSLYAWLNREIARRR